MKTTITLALALSLATGATVARGEEDIVVIKSRSVDQMVAEVSNDLDRQLARSTRYISGPNGNGYAMVRFTAGSDGRPANVSIYRASGDFDSKRAALRAVKQIKSLRPLPAELDDGQQFLANIVIASDSWSKTRFEDELQQAEAERLASSNPADHEMLALGNMTKGRM